MGTKVYLNTHNDLYTGRNKKDVTEGFFDVEFELTTGQVIRVRANPNYVIVSGNGVLIVEPVAANQIQIKERKI